MTTTGIFFSNGGFLAFASGTMMQKSKMMRTAGIAQGHRKISLAAAIFMFRRPAATGFETCVIPKGILLLYKIPSYFSTPETGPAAHFT
jgi:hypothetical protein